MRPGLYILSTSRDGDSLDAPTIAGPFADEAARVAAAQKEYADYKAAGSDHHEGWYELACWRLDVEPAGFTVGACIDDETPDPEEEDEEEEEEDDDDEDDPGSAAGEDDGSDGRP